MNPGGGTGPLWMSLAAAEERGRRGACGGAGRGGQLVRATKRWRQATVDGQSGGAEERGRHGRPKRSHGGTGARAGDGDWRMQANRAQSRKIWPVKDINCSTEK